jgi:glycerol-3-phosphate acyltransferase PlsX
MEMTAEALEAMRARNTSMYKAVMLVKENGYDGVISAGSTGAFLSLAMMKLRTVEGVDRAALVTALPTYDGKKMTLLDCGANVDVTKERLIQFAKMGRIYAEKVLHIENPNVRLLSNGAEDLKGTEIIKETNKALREAKYDWFKGNVEGREAVFGGTNVLVTGGFEGNIFLKTYEGTAKMMGKMIGDAFKKNFATKIGYLFAKSGVKELRSKMNYESVGGAMLLGTNGVVVKAHGSSTEYSFSCALGVCYDMIKADAVNLLKEGIKNG